MPDFTEEELLQIIAAGEADRVEFKESLAGDAATRIREAICAFANDLPGREKPGLVFIGVKNVADAMRTLGFVQRYGVGIPIAKNQLAAAGHPEPEFDISNSFVRATVRSRGAKQ